MKKFCIGIDIAKKTFDATAIFVESIDSLNEVGYRQFDNSTSGFRTLVSWAKKLCKQCNGKLSEDGLFCMETTGGYDRQICMYLHDKGQNVWRESALQIHRSSGFRRGKDDKADSRNISEYAAKHQDKLVLFSPDPTVIMELKEIVNYRATMVERRKEAKTRLSEKKFTTVLGKSQTERVINKMSESEIKTLDEIIEKCNQEIERIINSDEDMKRNYLHMTSINGLGLVNAACIIAYSSNFKKITTPNKMSCYAGAHTFYDESGTSVHKKDPSKNVCCKMIKNNLRMAARSAIIYNREIKAYADRLEKKGKPYSIVLNNVINKLLHITYSLIKNDCDYEYNHELLRKLKTVEPVLKTEPALEAAL